MQIIWKHNCYTFEMDKCYERMYSNKLYQLKNDVDNIDEIISFYSEVIIMNDINPTNMKIKKSNLHEYIIINQFIFQMRS